MSFILDALKKSELERQQQGSTELSGIPSSSPPAAVPRWLWVLGVLLAINLAVLIGLLLRPEAQDASPGNVITATSPVDAAPETALATTFAEQAEIARQSPPQRQAESTVIDRTENIDAVEAVLISQNPSSVSAQDLYPTIHEVRASGRLNLPELHLDIHVFNAAPEDRFVFINMTKLKEGSQLTEGPVVAEITPDGVVLGHQGQYFLLPRD